MGAADRNQAAADDACRRRIAHAVAEIAHERTLRSAAVAEICLRAGVPRGDFDRLFPSRQAAIRHAFTEAFDSLFDPVQAAVAAAPSWLGGLAGGLDALLTAAAEHPRLAELCLSYSLATPEDAAEHDYRAAVEAVSNFVGVARVHAEAEKQQAIDVPPMAEEFLAHGILSRAAQIAEHGGQPIRGSQSGDLLMLVLMTFFGTEEAARLCEELERGGLSEGGPAPTR